MVINVHAGHSAIGGGAPGAIGILNESIENRKVKDILINLLRTDGHTVYDCTVDNGTANSVLSGIVNLCNSHKANLDISLHFNAGANKNANGITTGTETLIYSDSSSNSYAKGIAQNIANEIAKLGFKNRGVKIRPDLYVLKKTSAPAVLVECCFVDDPDDAKLYNATKMAQAIFKGITGKAAPNSITQTTSTPKVSSTGNSNTSNTSFKVKINVNTLNVRSGPGTDYKINRTVSKGEVYTIVEKKNSWGRLKSGAGWINISSSYVKIIN